MTHYRRSSTDLLDELAAIAAGVAVGLGVAYLVRLVRQREPLDGEGGGDGPRERARLPAGERPRSGAESGERPRPGAEADAGS